MSNVLIKESYGTESPRVCYISSTTTGADVVVDKTRVKDGRPILNRSRHLSLKHFFKTAFLPQGYPESVSEDYLEYQCWDTLQAFCSSITGTLATQAMLKGYGVGDKSATAAAATITWMLKDGAGMLGRILFAWIQGTQLDCDAKRWRLFADILNDCAILLELIAPVFKSYFLLIACVSSVAKSIVGVAGGATRAALTLHQARRGNMADVSAKDGSQETLVNLLALLAGLVITPLVSNNHLLVWILFFIFTFGHLYSNYKAVSAVVMETINFPRYHILICKYVNTGQILSPKEVSKLDPVIRKPGYHLKINLGKPFSDIVKSRTDLNLAPPTSNNTKYILRLDFDNNKTCEGCLNIALHKDITSYELLQCAFQSLLIDAVIRNRISTKIPKGVFADTSRTQAIASLCSKWTSGNRNDPYFSWDLIALAHNSTIKLFPTFLKTLQETGWEIERNQLSPDEWRFTWELADFDYKKSI